MGLRESRRNFLRYLALSPELAGPLVLADRWREAFVLPSADDRPAEADGGSLRRAEQVLDVIEFEQLARTIWS